MLIPEIVALFKQMLKLHSQRKQMITLVLNSLLTFLLSIVLDRRGYKLYVHVNMNIFKTLWKQHNYKELILLPAILMDLPTTI